MAFPTNLYLTFERAVGGNGKRWIRTRRARGRSWQALAYEVTHDYGVHVTDEALRRWANELGMDTSRRDGKRKVS